MVRSENTAEVSKGRSFCSASPYQSGSRWTNPAVNQPTILTIFSLASHTREDFDFWLFMNKQKFGLCPLLSHHKYHTHVYTFVHRVTHQLIWRDTLKNFLSAYEIVIQFLQVTLDILPSERIRAHSYD